jgi:hypothetical protein
MARIIAMFTEKASAQQSCEECSDSILIFRSALSHCDIARPFVEEEGWRWHL